MKNIAYAGVLAALLDIDMEMVERCSRRSSEEAGADEVEPAAIGSATTTRPSAL